MCRVMVKKVDNKSPQDFNGQTPYDIAASHLMDKNPKDHNGQTPCNIASSNGHLEVCKLLMETFLEKNQVEDDVRNTYVAI